MMPENDSQIKLPSFKDSIIVLAVVAISLVIVQFIYEHLKAGGKDTLAYVVALGLIVMTITSVWKILLRNVDSPYFAVSSLIGIALGTSVGTFVRQTVPGEGFESQFGPSLSKAMQFFQADQVFSSWWYVSLFVLVLISLVKRSAWKRFGMENLGFHLAHLSPILILAGFWVDHFFGFRGIIKLEVGQQSNEVELYKTPTSFQSGIKELDFSIRLDSFKFEKFEPDYRLQIWRMEKKVSEELMPNNSHFEQGKPVFLASHELVKDKIRHIYGTNLYFRMLDFYPNFYFEYDYPVDPDTIGVENPGVLLTFATAVGETILQLKTSPEGRNILADPKMDYWIEYYYELPQEVEEKIQYPERHASDDYQKKIILHGKEQRLYFLEKSEVRSEGVKLDSKYTFPGQEEISFVVKFFYPDGKFLRSLPATRDDILQNPVAKVELWGRDWPNSELAYIYPSKGGKGGIFRFPNSEYMIALESLKDRETRYWRSTVTALDNNGNPLKTESIIVNEPMNHNGYRFYQTDYDPSNPNYSGIGVSHEPGLHIIYLGFILMMMGIFEMFFARKRQRME